MAPSVVLADLPEAVRTALASLIGELSTRLGDALRSIVLYGSAAEGRLRPTSDVNLVIVLRRFDRAEIDPARAAIRVAEALARTRTMFLLESEIDAAATAFAIKFADIRRRRRVLLGDDPFQTLSIPRSAVSSRLEQVLLNLQLRLREAYALRSLREEQLARTVAEAAGPLRVCAAALLEIEGEPVPPPKAALERVAATLPGGEWDDLLQTMSTARLEKALPPGVAGTALLRLIDLADRMRARARQ